MTIAKRPIYVIGHRCNDVEDIQAALKDGANTIECDFRYGRVTVFDDYDWFLDHDGVYAWSTELEPWLKAAAKCAKKYKKRFALIIVHLKTFEHLHGLRSRLREALPVDLNILYCLSSYSDRKAFKQISSDLRFNEGLLIDEDDDPGKISKYLAGTLGVANCWYGDGIFVAGVDSDVRPALVKAADVRDNTCGIKKNYVWTLAKESSIEDYLENVKVDGVLVNEGTIADAVKIVNKSKTVRRAKRSDRAFFVFSAGETGTLDSPMNVVGHWKKWPANFLPIDAAIVRPNGKGYFFKGDQYLRYTPCKGVDAGFPKKIIGNWKKWPKDFFPLDAAVFWPPNGKAYFFKGDRYLRYTLGHGVDSGYPKKIIGNWLKWPKDFFPLDAALFWPSTGKAYFFKGTEYVRYTPGVGVDAGYPKMIANNWKKWPADFLPLDSAVQWSSGIVYFFHGGKYSRYRPG